MLINVKLLIDYLVTFTTSTSSTSLTTAAKTFSNLSSSHFTFTSTVVTTSTS